MKTHHGFLLLAACVTVIGANARSLTPQEALRRAMPEMRTMQMENSATVQPELKLTCEKSGSPTVYVFSLPNNGGYVVLPADDAVNAHVLGYSDTGSFNPAQMPPAMEWWLSQYSEEIASLGSSPRSETEEEPGSGPVGYPDIEPLLTTSWNQTDPYNLLCPEYNGERCPSGCVATAMAQVMKHWNYPAKGTGSHSYNGGYYAGGTLEVDFSATTYDWSQMTDTYTSSSTEEQRNAVATLMYSCGVSVNMSYAPNSSGSNYEYASTALVTYFGYDKGLRDLSRNYFGIESWTQMLYDELKAGRPVLYGGRNDNGGHAFVCDGYRTDGYFHFNWGWGGYSNGYFLVTALNPTDQGVGASVGGYNQSQTVIVGIQPAQNGSEYRPVMEFLSDFDVRENDYTRTATGTVEFFDTKGIRNESLGEMDLVFGVKLEDESGNITFVGSEKAVTLRKGATTMSFSVPQSSFPTSGTYTVTPVVRASDCQSWHDAFVLMGNVREYTLVATPTTLSFSPIGGPTLTQTGLSVNSSVYPGRTCVITATLTNPAEQEYYGPVTPIIISGDYIISEADELVVDLEGGQNQDCVWETAFPSSLKPGTYMLYLLDSSGHKIGSGTSITVKTAPTEAADPYVSSVSICGVDASGTTERNPLNVDASQFAVDMTIANHSGYFTETVNAEVWYSEAQGMVGLGGTFVAIDAGQTAKIVTEPRDITQNGASIGETYILYAKGITTGTVGKPAYFKVTSAAGLQQIDAPEQFTIFTDGNILHVAGPEAINRVMVYDISGVSVMDTPSSDLDISHLSEGVYFVTARTVTGALYRTKFLHR